jgi:hypothetical protein
VNALKKTSFSSKFSVLFAEQLATAPFSDAQRASFGRKKKEAREEKIWAHFRFSPESKTFSHLSKKISIFTSLLV